MGEFTLKNDAQTSVFEVYPDTEVLVVRGCSALAEIRAGLGLKRVYVQECPLLSVLDIGGAEEVSVVDCPALTVGRLPSARKVYVAGCGAVWWGAWFWPVAEKAAIERTPVVIPDPHDSPPALHGFATDSRALVDRLPRIPAALLVLHSLESRCCNTPCNDDEALLGPVCAPQSSVLMVPVGPRAVVMRDTPCISVLVLDDAVERVALIGCPDITRVLGNGVISWNTEACPRFAGVHINSVPAPCSPSLCARPSPSLPPTSAPTFRCCCCCSGTAPQAASLACSPPTPTHAWGRGAETPDVWWQTPLPEPLSDPPTPWHL